jgi:sialic acid synthase SpsE
MSENTYIIAEISSNFKTLNDCAQCISLAKVAGADAVKFQLFSEYDLYGFGDKTYKYPSIQKTWLPCLKDKADACEIDFMCTAFSPNAYRLVDNFVKAHKIASCENTHSGILELVSIMKKPIYMSCGASHALDIKRSLKILKEHEHRITLLYCVVEYPCNEVKLEQIQNLRRIDPTVRVGYSCHSQDYTTIPVEAINYGASVIEKHFNPLGILGAPDELHSIGIDQFRKMVKRIRGQRSEVYTPAENEKDAVLSYNRRVVAIRDIKKGETFNLDNVGCFRSKVHSARGAHPFNLAAILFKQAERNYTIGQGVDVPD